ncbi:MAG TPA: flagellar export chaperone FliS [Bryobacteraceae bacterium]|nr:flagellar export chaperone FliS [Bryobacteraceae bacterium]
MWRNVYVDTRVLSADPLELVHILYEHTLTMVGDARRFLAEGNIAARGHSISRAIAAIDELNCSLDRDAGGSIASNLGALYQYMRSRLLTANIRQEDAPLAEVESLLRTLGEAWNAIRPAAQAESRDSSEPQRALAFAAGEPEFAGQGWNA